MDERLFDDTSVHGRPRASTAAFEELYGVLIEFYYFPAFRFSALVGR